MQNQIKEIVFAFHIVAVPYKKPKANSIFPMATIRIWIRSAERTKNKGFILLNVCTKMAIGM